MTSTTTTQSAAEQLAEATQDLARSSARRTTLAATGDPDHAQELATLTARIELLTVRVDQLHVSVALEQEAEQAQLRTAYAQAAKARSAAEHISFVESLRAFEDAAAQFTQAAGSFIHVHQSIVQEANVLTGGTDTDQIKVGAPGVRFDDNRIIRPRTAEITTAFLKAVKPVADLLDASLSSEIGTRVYSGDVNPEFEKEK